MPQKDRRMTPPQYVLRKSRVLTPSQLRCLKDVAAVNLTAGCSHGCAFCYIQGYRQFPGYRQVRVYAGTAQRIKRELERKRSIPAAVYFSPSSDPFMNVPAVLDEAYESMKTLLAHRISVQCVTKGRIPQRFFDLFAEAPELVSVQMGLTSLDSTYQAWIEPGAADAERRLEDLERLQGIGVWTSVRADPLIPGVTDTEAGLDQLFEAISLRHIKDVSASYLFLRPALKHVLKQHTRNTRWGRAWQEAFNESRDLAIQGAGTSGKTLPFRYRREGFERLQRLGRKYGLDIRICGCKNADLSSGRCHLTRWKAMNRRTSTARQPCLFDLFSVERGE